MSDQARRTSKNSRGFSKNRGSGKRKVNPNKNSVTGHDAFTADPRVAKLEILQRTLGMRNVDVLWRAGALEKALGVKSPTDRGSKRANRPIDGKNETKSTHSISAGRNLRDSVREIQTAGGRPLPRNEKRFMESRFHHDFSDVRIHDDPRSHKTAEAIRAKAFTVGTNIGFNKGEYRPGTREGRKLLAHELTHVVQQGGAGQFGKVPALQRDPVDEAGSLQEKLNILESQTNTHLEQANQDIGRMRANGSRADRALQRGICARYGPAAIALKRAHDLFKASWELSFWNRAVRNEILQSHTVTWKYLTHAHIGGTAPENTFEFFSNAEKVASISTAVTRYRRALEAAEQVGGIANTLMKINRNALAIMLLCQQSGLRIIAGTGSRGISEIAAAFAIISDVNQDLQIVTRGYGDYTGSESNDTHSSNPEETDCVTYVMSALRAAYRAKGRESFWLRLVADATRNSRRLGLRGLAGTELIKLLQSRDRWKGIFFARNIPDQDTGDDSVHAAFGGNERRVATMAPDQFRAALATISHGQTRDHLVTLASRNVSAAKAEVRAAMERVDIRFAHSQARAYGKYAHNAVDRAGVKVDRTTMMLNFSHTNPEIRERARAAARPILNSINFGFVAVKGGTHTAVLIRGLIYEVHWDYICTDPNLFEGGIDFFHWHDRVAWRHGMISSPDL